MMDIINMAIDRVQTTNLTNLNCIPVSNIIVFCLWSIRYSKTYTCMRNTKSFDTGFFSTIAVKYSFSIGINQHFREKFFGCLFIPKVPLETGAPPPQLFDASYAPGCRKEDGYKVGAMTAKLQ